MKYLVVYEWAETNWSAYVPDLPGCVSTGTTKEEVRREIREAIAFHLRGMQEDVDAAPESRTWAEVVDIDVPAEATP